jgi:hypothetical protein
LWPLWALQEEEAGKDVLRAVAEALPAVTRPASATSETIQAALEHEALMTFFASLPYVQSSPPLMQQVTSI